ncbi:NAD(P)/FAD-dependent oxidoreductase [Alteromonas sp. C1M14]|uniref:NAD(P)/FAD-dependent oxidoreductase n=1 Tax=Alteromonas sp. C1M14 TaxID=2841567 RepID=UPI001C08935C|nr:NAD(P)/FAD-dependent oxidoreductase [Alteromonas sp. C1M14]MBU2977102.1 NAD(P)/FAD-dependent oxidoreductase [Alteromonas sp. C1M14]
MQYDVVIIGGSFAGLSAAMQLVRARRTVLVIDANTPRNRFSSHSHGVFGLDGERPQQIRTRALQQLFAYPTFTLMEGFVEKVIPEALGFSVKTTKENVTSRRMVLAMGVKDNLPSIEGLAQYWGKNVVHCPYCHGYELSETNLGVLATSDMSFHQAAMLPDWGATTLFTQHKFKPDRELERVLKLRGVKIEDAEIVKVLGNQQQLEHVALSDGRTLSLGGLYIIPQIQVLNPIVSDLSLTLTSSPLGQIVEVDPLKESAIKGVFVAGDMSNPMQNGTLAAASGTLAGIGVHRSLIFNNH